MNLNLGKQSPAIALIVVGDALTQKWNEDYNMKNYSILTVKHNPSHHANPLHSDWLFKTDSIKAAGGLDKHIRDIELMWGVKVVGITQYPETLDLDTHKLLKVETKAW